MFFFPFFYWFLLDDDCDDYDDYDANDAIARSTERNRDRAITSLPFFSFQGQFNFTTCIRY